ncbi:hypothetical protein HK101_004814 [Irineochytrium annulatum]|nr:hypothetical protein HK101_004814 [Irineochytrium annulatum]
MTTDPAAVHLVHHKRPLYHCYSHNNGSGFVNGSHDADDGAVDGDAMDYHLIIENPYNPNDLTLDGICLTQRLLRRYCRKGLVVVSLAVSFLFSYIKKVTVDLGVIAKVPADAYIPATAASR